MRIVFSVATGVKDDNFGRRAGRTASAKALTRSSGAIKLRFRRYDGDAFTNPKRPNSSRNRRGKDKNKNKEKD